MYTSVFKGLDCIILENDHIKVTVLPSLGGKIASFVEKSKGFELLYQSKCAKLEPLQASDVFGKAAWGFDDTFPNIGAERVGDILYPDHGDLWKRSFEADGSTLKVIGDVLPYRYSKTLKIENSQLRISYQIENLGDAPMPFIWTMHCLINCQSDMKLLFPKGTKSVEITTPDSNYLGEEGTIHPFPVTADVFGNSYRLDRVFDKSAKKFENYYVSAPVDEGVCGAYYPSEDLRFTTYFDNEKLPFLGFWVTEGGYQGDYNCALEPSSGYYGFISKAAQNYTLRYLEKGKPFEFEIVMELV